MDNEKDIVFSQSIKAGKRIYYLDVKRNKRGELFLAITESKKIIMGEGPEAPYSFEKHKIFLYQEDFTKFIGALSKAIGYIHDNQSPDYRCPNAASPIPTTEELISEEPLSELGEELDIKIDFE
ncbi:MAG: PUR family DNA/RNA-binding protein [Bacteroidaceae bacterium]|nr:PUR family DNA/RNA-binding protein [Bacteroidaceae bacterium]MBQ3238905.1 PUR family DNA/RNA-binding protein [Bacteroidaceae bacterium]